MENLQANHLMEFNPNTLESVRREFNLDQPGRFDEAIDILEEWVKKQNHFTKKVYAREYLERIIIACKGSVESAKIRMDRLCTFKTMMPIFFENKNEKEFYRLLNTITQAHLPKMTPDDQRVYLLRVNGVPEESAFHTLYKYIMIIGEYMLRHDYTKGFVVIFDFRETNLMKILHMLNIIELQKLFNILMNGYGLRLKGIHFITTSKAVTSVVSLLKQVLREKLHSRFHCHRNIETLYDYVPLDILPEEYGGKERPLKTLHEEFLQMYCTEEFTKYLQEMIDAKTIESLRQTDKFTEHYAGMPGSFRCLSVD